MRDINKIIVHASFTPEHRHVSVEDIRNWHLDRGWSDIGYHIVIYLDGTIHYGRDVKRIGSHTRGHNRNSIGICYIGGATVVNSVLMPKDTRTAQQREALETTLSFLKRVYPKAVVHGHRDFSTKSCPNFDATSEYKHISDMLLNN